MTTRTFADNTRRPIINTVTIVSLELCGSCLENMDPSLTVLSVTLHLYTSPCSHSGRFGLAVWEEGLQRAASEHGHQVHPVPAAGAVSSAAQQPLQRVLQIRWQGNVSTYAELILFLFFFAIRDARCFSHSWKMQLSWQSFCATWRYASWGMFLRVFTPRRIMCHLSFLYFISELLGDKKKEKKASTKVVCKLLGLG